MSKSAKYRRPIKPPFYRRRPGAEHLVTSAKRTVWPTAAVTSLYGHAPTPSNPFCTFLTRPTNNDGFPPVSGDSSVAVGLPLLRMGDSKRRIGLDQRPALLRSAQPPTSSLHLKCDIVATPMRVSLAIPACDGKFRLPDRRRSAPPRRSTATHSRSILCNMVSL